MNEDRFTGCMLGLALGDACGAPHEGGPLERLLWRVIGTTAGGAMRWTDDTQMSLDLAESLLDKGRLDQDDLALRFARSYHWSRGYGPGAAKLLKRIAKGQAWRLANRAIFTSGSFGNGGAMRAPIIGLCYARNPERVPENARLSASVTHAHPLGMEAAALVAMATALALGRRDPMLILRGAGLICRDDQLLAKLASAEASLCAATELTPAQVVNRLGNGIAALDSCVTALYLGLRFLDRPFTDLLEFVAICGGDADTIGAMAGAIWGAANGGSSFPHLLLQRLEQVDRLRATGRAMYLRFSLDSPLGQR
ncbi:MAG: ADP-ribosylglycohydrolase family protein [Pseudomonadota bacterium]